MRDKRKEFSRDELNGKSGEMLVHALNHMVTLGISLEKRCEMSRAQEEMKQIILQKPEIDDMEQYVKEKAEKMASMFLHPNTPETNQYKCEDFITQIIKDARGGKHEKPKR